MKNSIMVLDNKFISRMLCYKIIIPEIGNKRVEGNIRWQPLCKAANDYQQGYISIIAPLCACQVNVCVCG